MKKITISSSDIISSLSSELKVKILEHLPIRDAVRTSVLSTKWRYVWASLPKLVFDEHKFMHDRINFRFSESVDRVLLLHTGRILQFKLVVEFQRSENIDRWIFVLSRKKIQDFRLILFEPMDYNVHSSLFFCHELRHVRLYNCNIALPRNFNGFSKLTTLRLCEVTISNGDLKSLVSSCTQLQRLELMYMKNSTCLDIEGKEAQHLTIHGFSLCLILANSHLIDKDIDLITGVVNLPTNLLACQSLVHLKVCDGELTVPENFRGLDKLESLRLSNVRFSPNALKTLTLSCPQLKELALSPSPGCNDLNIQSENLQSLKIVSGFEHLHLVAPLLNDASIYLLSENRWEHAKIQQEIQVKNDQLLEVLANSHAKVTLPLTFNYLLNLYFEVEFGNVISEYAAFCFLEKTNAVQKLEIKACSAREYSSPNIWEHLKSSRLEFSFDCLLILRFLGFSGAETELSFLEFILNSAPVLEKIVITSVGEIIMQTDILKKLLKFKRLSKQAEIIYV
ncbi:F-box/LRR-repeat protein At3g26922-like [Dioscorea cayenensis subsp. rotundata]|uniref:F-box/LRR-repeat protein At3g26922-like n=1 Tax=Dioscorea cayennensis subsp. rotundata TaxID=55577 RepID=A0AB40CR71_DIOCR|nr:F-box/LRR-repeat protein At3g26922-like [Dioscorea cayenensis subsp. rotundata]XP_039142539.1 F-box/LRR-repeat protein At3g26922-like [Dioscorea cayenensis subsp. rotundata]XP_039142540.1 F-box/LRR-repeat protein At3g26922-like [Dioscorea cayenensis subsp. rotundata]XP_039142541.1 F-box/LRR-repeat protein At3g26922-like [Dioscorea cayenensis subsp. rotundata]